MNAVLSKLINIWETEPVAVTGLLTAVLDAAIVFGAPISDDQKTAVIALFTALGVIVARSQVTPVSGATQ